MEEVKQKIERFINNIVSNKNYKILDMLYVFLLSLQQFSKSRYRDNKDNFKKLYAKIVQRALKIKHHLEVNEIKNCFNYFNDKFMNILGVSFLSYEAFDKDVCLFQEILTTKTIEITFKSIMGKIIDLKELDRSVLSFILNLIPIRLKESLEGGKELDYTNYKILEDFLVKDQDDKVEYFKIDIEKWTYIFNQLNNQQLKAQNLRIKLPIKKKSIVLSQLDSMKEFKFWELGDIILKLGIGYWIPYFTNSGNPEIHFKIPSFIYNNIYNSISSTYEISDFSEILRECEIQAIAELGKESWDRNEFFEEDIKVLEYDIENEIVSNPEIIEEGLELIKSQFRTEVGLIDILLKDRNEDYVVVELKKDQGTYKVVGQILKYLVWVEEELAKDSKVRGIIVVKETNKDLEYAVRGTRFPIKIKTFGDEPPIKEKMKHCDQCGEVNRVSAQFCVKCGKKFWMV